MVKTLPWLPMPLDSTLQARPGPRVRPPPRHSLFLALTPLDHLLQNLPPPLYHLLPTRALGCSLISFHWGLSTNPCRVPTYMQGNSGVSCWQDFLCVCRGWRGAYACEASALGSAVKILSATHPNDSPGLGLWTGYVTLTTCR